MLSVLVRRKLHSGRGGSRTPVLKVSSGRLVSGAGGEATPQLQQSSDHAPFLKRL